MIRGVALGITGIIVLATLSWFAATTVTAQLGHGTDAGGLIQETLVLVFVTVFSWWCWLAPWPIHIRVLISMTAAVAATPAIWQADIDTQKMTVGGLLVSGILFGLLRTSGYAGAFRKPLVRNRSRTWSIQTLMLFTLVIAVVCAAASMATQQRLGDDGQRAFLLTTVCLLLATTAIVTLVDFSWAIKSAATATQYGGVLLACWLASGGTNFFLDAVFASSVGGIWVAAIFLWFRGRGVALQRGSPKFAQLSKVSETDFSP